MSEDRGRLSDGYDTCFRACKPCKGCGQHIPKGRTPPLCSKCAPVGQEVLARVVTGASTDALQEALRIHHPIMRSETGPFSGCRCGQVGLGQDVIAHVVTELCAALDGRR